MQQVYNDLMKVGFGNLIVSLWRINEELLLFKLLKINFRRFLKITTECIELEYTRQFAST